MSSGHIKGDFQELDVSIDHYHMNVVQYTHRMENMSIDAGPFCEMLVLIAGHLYGLQVIYIDCRSSLPIAGHLYGLLTISMDCWSSSRVERRSSPWIAGHLYGLLPISMDCWLSSRVESRSSPWIAGHLSIDCRSSPKECT